MLSCLLRDDKRLNVFFASLDKKKPYLLALSGGSDSIFLFYLLKAYRMTFTVCHVDYGWRDSSTEEAEVLSQHCSTEGVPCIVRRVPAEVEQTEEAARNYRYSLFRQLCQEQGFAGVFLAHHADDQAETILKRILEGAHFTAFKGMQEKSEVHGLLLLRPLLHLPKRLLRSYLDKAQVSYIQDTTNLDEQYLRARMRKKLFPWLGELFGKNVTTPLLQLAEGALELSHYLDAQAKPYLQSKKLSCSRKLLEQPFLAKYVLKSFFSLQGLVASKHFLQAVYVHLLQGSNIRLRLRSKIVIVKSGEVAVE